MPTSQFKFYSANDPQGPGPIYGNTGSLINILDYVLVAGYGTGSFFKAPAGWTKPFQNSASISSSATGSAAYGCYRQGGGSSMSLFVNDFGVNVTMGNREATITGWETLTFSGSTCGPSQLLGGDRSGSVGIGLGQFPLPAQQNTFGFVIVRKSLTFDSASSNPRYWMIFADDTTMYMWIATGDAAGRYYHWMFGDIFSYAGASDIWKCSIYGRASFDTIGRGQNSNNGIAYDYTDIIPPGSSFGVGNFVTTAQPGHYIARTGYGGGTSLNYTKRGDIASCDPNPWANPSPMASPINGNISCPNSSDNSFYMSPLYVVEPANPITLRGKLRGLYQVLHPVASFVDGQIISGSGEYVGKGFQIIHQSVVGSFWAIETTPTVDKN
jgi:hypothetical protein